MAPARRRVSYVIPPPTDPPPRLQLPPHGVPRHGSTGPILIPLQSAGPPPPPTPKWTQHPRHRLGVSCLALDSSTQLVGRASPEGILYTGGRDGMAIAWDLGVPTMRRGQRYGYAGRGMRRWEVMTNWADDVIEEEAEEGDGYRSDGDVLGEVTGRARRRIPTDNAIPYEEQWETDMDAYQALKAHPPTSHFRQAVQMHSDWINDMILCNYNQTLVTASSDGTIKAWSPHTHGQSAPLHEPTVVGTHSDYVRCLAYCREQQWFASGSFDRTIRLWDLASASHRADPLITLHTPEGAGAKASVYALTTDPYGSVIASGSPERVIRMWDPRSGKRIAKLVGHTDNIRAILISEDAKYLLTGSADASIKLWSLSSQRCLHTFTHHTESVWSLFSSHPSLEVFYSGDRSGLVCKVDVEGCADVSEGECILLCQDSGSDRPGTSGSGSEGINKIVAMDDNLLWTASGSSSVRRWRVPGRRALRATALTAEGAVDSPVSSPRPLDYRHPDSPTRSKSVPRSPSLSQTNSRSSSPPTSLSNNGNTTADPELELDPDREGEETWYGIPFESLVRLTSPNDSGFGMGGPALRAPDAEIATLYSAASVRSVPRMVRSPVQAMFGQPPSAALRSSSPFRSDTLRSQTEPRPPNAGEDSQTVQAPRPRAAYEIREVAADAVPLRLEADEVIHGEHGLVRCLMLNDRMHALTVDTAGEVAVWDVVRGVCLGRFPCADVAAASFCGSAKSQKSEKSGGEETQRSPREALETVRERIEGEAVVPSWAALETKTGVLTVHVSERCFEAEVYADEAGYGHGHGHERMNEEIRFNIGKWVLRNLFYGFIREEQRQAARRAKEHGGHDSSQHRMQRGSVPSHIELSNASSHGRSRASSDVSVRSSSSASAGPRSPTGIILSPTMLPAVSPVISAAHRSSPLMTPMIPLHGALRDSGLPTIPQSPNLADATPMPISHGLRDSQRSDNSTGSGVPPSAYGTVNADYVSHHGISRRPSVSTPGGLTTPDDFSGWGGKSTLSVGSGSDATPLVSPSTPTMGSLMGRLNKAFSKTKRQPSENAGTMSQGTATSTSMDTPAEDPSPPIKTPAQALLAGPITPPSSSEAPTLPVPSSTSIIISEEAPSGWLTLYRGHVSSTGLDVRLLEEAMPLWSLECVLQNKIPPIQVTKVSFVLLPFKEPGVEPLPELLNTQQSKLTASRFLRVRKLTVHVQDKLDKIASGGGNSPVSMSMTPRSSIDRRSTSSARARDHDSRPRADELYEILCNGIILSLDMTLAAVRQYIWRQSGELVMHYRRKAVPVRPAIHGQP
ncbi:transporter [Ganoderma sinense ZZ0214-1]|uniref:Transporter n=1 Tax=Ganoderma sinense ZZ0214-1 TaxID=1077348 RepID=A0A2G8RZ78_9APHY|nr:transporter [Ganoderma sinense ZZ0214-1]